MHIYGAPVYYRKELEDGRVLRRRVFYLQEASELEGLGWERGNKPKEEESDTQTEPQEQEEPDPAPSPEPAAEEVLVPGVEDDTFEADEQIEEKQPTELEFMSKAELIEYGRKIGAPVSASMNKQAIVDTLKKAEPRFLYPDKWAPPKKAKRFDRITAPDGSEWIFDQPRLEDGRYEHDDPTTPEFESALTWMPFEEVDGSDV